MLKGIPTGSYDKKLSIRELAKSLHYGSLALVIGAGASIGLGFPSWWELVKRCREKSGLEATDINENSSSDKITKMTGAVEKEQGGGITYRKFVRDCLYEGIDYNRDRMTIMKKELLIAFGAMLMGSKRGSVNQVLNFNFDDSLEWYLGLHGFKAQVIKGLPSLSRDVDVSIYHPHGYLPFSDDDHMSEFLIFTKYSYDERLGAPYELWKEMTRVILQSKVVLFVGLSGNDPMFGPLLASVKQSVCEERPTGFWLFGHQLDKDNKEYLIDLNIVPLCFENYQEIPIFLLDICREAATF